MWHFLVSMLSLLIITTSAYGKYQYGTFSENSVAFSSFDLFLEPDTLSTKGFSILPGTEIQIICKPENTLSENSFTTDWYEISCNTSDGIKSGYSLSSNFAYSYDILSDGSIFAFGITAFDTETNRFEGLGRVIFDGVIVAETNLEPPHDPWGNNSVFIYSVDSHLIDTEGYSDVTDIPLLSFTYEACGYENRDLPVFWTGELLISAPHTSSVFEAMIFHWFENHIFASDSLGQENTLVIHTLGEQWDDERSEYFVSSETDRSFLWTENEFRELED